MSATCRRHDTECRRLGKKTTRRHPTCGAKVAASSRRSTIYPARRFLVHFFMYEKFLVNRKVPFLISRSYRIFSITLVPYLVMYITSYSIRIVLLSPYVNIYDTMAPMSVRGSSLTHVSNILLGIIQTLLGTNKAVM